MKLDPKYFLSIGDRRSVLYGGLLEAATGSGLASLNTTVLQSPSKDNVFTAIVKAEARRSTRYGDELVQRSYSATGEACPGNVVEELKHSLIMTAETRAVGRVLSLMLGVGEPLYEDAETGSFSAAYKEEAAGYAGAVEEQKELREGTEELEISSPSIENNAERPVSHTSDFGRFPHNDPPEEAEPPISEPSTPPTQDTAEEKKEEVVAEDPELLIGQEETFCSLVAQLGLTWEGRTPTIKQKWAAKLLSVGEVMDPARVDPDTINLAQWKVINGLISGYIKVTGGDGYWLEKEHILLELYQHLDAKAKKPDSLYQLTYSHWRTMTARVAAIRKDKHTLDKHRKRFFATANAEVQEDGSIGRWNTVGLDPKQREAVIAARRAWCAAQLDKPVASCSELVDTEWMFLADQLEMEARQAQKGRK